MNFKVHTLYKFVYNKYDDQLLKFVVDCVEGLSIISTKIISKSVKYNVRCFVYDVHSCGRYSGTNYEF